MPAYCAVRVHIMHCTHTHCTILAELFRPATQNGTRLGVNDLPLDFFATIYTRHLSQQSGRDFLAVLSIHVLSLRRMMIIISLKWVGGWEGRDSISGRSVMNCTLWRQMHVLSPCSEKKRSHNEEGGHLPKQFFYFFFLNCYQFVWSSCLSRAWTQCRRGGYRMEIELQFRSGQSRHLLYKMSRNTS